MSAESALIYLTICLALFILNPGRYSLDQRLMAQLSKVKKDEANIYFLLSFSCGDNLKNLIMVLGWI